MTDPFTHDFPTNYTTGDGWDYNPTFSELETMLQHVSADGTTHNPPSFETDEARFGNHPWHDVTVSGAEGDGTTDDTQSIQDALNSTASRVYLPAGTYNITSPIDTGSTHLFGDGIGETVISVGSEVDHAIAVSGDHGSVSDLSVQGGDLTPVGVRMAGADTVCERVAVDNVTQPGTVTTTVACIAGFSAHDCRIRDCIATRADAPNSGVARGILLDGTSGGGALVEGNRVDDITPVADADGIVVQNGNPNCRITDNHVTNAAKSAIKVNAGAENCTVTGNTLHAGSDALAVMRIQASGTAFTGNAISVPTVSGELVRVSDAASGAVISGNFLELTGGVGAIEGIQIRTDEEDITIDGNTIKMNGTGADGIAIDTSRNVTIAGNTITDCGERGIEVMGTTGCVVNGNIIDGTGNDGILIQTGSTDILVDGNVINSATTAIQDDTGTATIGTNST